MWGKVGTEVGETDTGRKQACGGGAGVMGPFWGYRVGGGKAEQEGAVRASERQRSPRRGWGGGVCKYVTR